MLVLLGTFSILFFGASTLGRGDLLFRRSMMMDIQRSETAADMDTAMMIGKPPISKCLNQERRRTKKKSSGQLTKSGK